jgi:hypothetical protein
MRKPKKIQYKKNKKKILNRYKKLTPTTTALIANKMTKKSWILDSKIKI